MKLALTLLFFALYVIGFQLWMWTYLTWALNYAGSMLLADFEEGPIRHRWMVPLIIGSLGLVAVSL